ncbi:hypothetical protein MMC07_001621 [Pseudocyphellaria aurata]|nr:hypothetical protein [Pseudocyphellaria aurata]
MADSTADSKFDLVVRLLLEAGYTRSNLTDFLMDGLDNLRRGNGSDLEPNPSEVQTTIAEALACNEKVGKLTGLPRGKREDSKNGATAKQKDTAVPPIARPKTPPPVLPVALPPTPQSEEVPRGSKKRKELADAEPSDQGLADDFASRLTFIDKANVPEPTTPCPKRLRPNPFSLPFSLKQPARRERERRSLDRLFSAQSWKEFQANRSSYLEKQLARRERERISLDRLFSVQKWDEWQGMPTPFPFSASGSGGASTTAGSKVSSRVVGRFVSPQEDYGIR